MISELLDKRFVVDSMKWLCDRVKKEAVLLRQGNADARERSDRAAISERNLDEAEDAISRALKQELICSAMPASVEPFFPRDPVTALVQSQLHQFFEERNLVQDFQGQSLAPNDIAVTNRTLSPGALAGPANRLFGAFEQTDAGWISCKIAEAITWFKGRHEFSDSPSHITIGNKARMILVADWATAVPRAQLIGKRMRQQLLHPDAITRERHVIHLGDVYYSGYRNEYNNHFLRDWPVLAGEERTIGSWCLNANHDMFSGGRDYFGYLLRQARFQRHNGCSYFCLENDDWQIFGLDTGYDEYDLHGNQTAWIQQIHRQHPAKKIMLLSHHQPFSLYGERGSPEVLEKLKRVLESDKVRVWFWGHEHRCAIYKARDNINSPRLIGNGGVPVWAPTGSKPDGVDFEYTAFVPSGLEKFLKLGFAVLDFEAGNVSVKYIGEDGQPYWQETLS